MFSEFVRTDHLVMKITVLNEYFTSFNKQQWRDHKRLSPGKGIPRGPEDARCPFLSSRTLHVPESLSTLGPVSSQWEFDCQPFKFEASDLMLILFTARN